MLTKLLRVFRIAQPKNILPLDEAKKIHLEGE
ncbi:hypothetical protein CHY_1823 [Carboxydothermus hydrogenoformans Z-2901]|uniref:Uncharacterized protein n=1 Tax=Carboxydothermus hydrogenoformans (strain ATCC BAA-161 / DSM 6008 / Z-2901) TaxID=246194 RepID=Q3AB41_CARHZ|nr:hypothetical protein CHY_1823 [Carboxydothermus hydrogenoformans Z-2901]